MTKSKDPKCHQVAGKLCKAITLYIFPHEVVRSYNFHLRVVAFLNPANLYFYQVNSVGSLGGARGTVHIEARTTPQVRETPHSYPKPQGYGFMGHLTYNVFNLYYFIQCGTYNSHLQTNTSPQV
ncbi:hypothetical protein MTR_5g005790 [Medicago truncatula]|uniref:Uncharacterized protein n=1 Tax=Medicago truncatula TaxID=3880 RepID=G7K298_MEDTR|nr:hypothetical protein MTR_5g005790 [Medicago truncatula]